MEQIRIEQALKLKNSSNQDDSRSSNSRSS